MTGTDDRNETETDGGTEFAAAGGSKHSDGPAVAEGIRGNGAVDPTPRAGQDFLVETIRRAPLLRALTDGPASIADLSDSVDMSRSTIHRATNSLAERHLLRRSNGEYELTILGEIVAEKTGTFGEDVETAASLEPFLNTIDTAEVPVEHFVDASVSRPTPRQPHTSIQRIIELIEGSDTLHMLSTVLSPIYVDVGYREMMDGMQIEAVFDREAIDIMVTQYAEKAYETISTGNFSVYAHDGLPFELFVLDDMVGMAAHDDYGVARVLVECDDPEAIEWAERLYRERRSEADPLLVSDL